MSEINLMLCYYYVIIMLCYNLCCYFPPKVNDCCEISCCKVRFTRIVSEVVPHLKKTYQVSL